ncbi:MAG: sodium:solute symporter family protein [Zestosphaera sp.]
MNQDPIIASSIVLSVIFISVAIGLITSRLRLKTLRADTYIVAGRTLGTIVFFLNSAAVIYSGYTFLGTAGYSYTYGAATMFAWGTSLLGYVAGYLLAPRVWSLAKKHNLMTLSDFIMWRYDSKLLMVLAAIVSIVFQIPYVQLQIQAVSIILDTVSYGMLPSLHLSVAVLGLVILYVFLGGMVSIALTNVFLGAIMLVTMFGGSWALILKYFGGLPGLYDAVASVSPAHLTLPGPGGLRPETWFISSVVGTGLGFWCWSQRVQTLFTAKDVKVLKKGMVLNSWYLILGSLWVTHMGLVALALGIKLRSSDYAFLNLVGLSFGPSVLGLIAAGGAAASLSTAAGILLDQASTISRNLIQQVFKPKIGDKELINITRVAVAGLGVVSTILAYTSPALLVDLLLVGYAGVAQLLPGLFIGIFWKSLRKHEVTSGLIAGELTVLGIFALMRYYGWKLEPLGIHGIVWGLASNLLVITLVHCARRLLSEGKGA